MKTGLLYFGDLFSDAEDGFLKFFLDKKVLGDYVEETDDEEKVKEQITYGKVTSENMRK